MSEHVARFMVNEVAKRSGIETDPIDILTIPIPTTDEGEAIKESRFADMVMHSDALVLVVPEYNHGYPGLLKHVLDKNLKEYIHKAVGICGVSAGQFGGTRVIENLLPVMRELGLVTIFWDGNFSNVNQIFDTEGKLLNHAFIKRTDRFLNELVWMAKVLRYGCENVSIGRRKPWLSAPRSLQREDTDACHKCGAVMNHHAKKLDLTSAPQESSATDRSWGGILQDLYACPVEILRCGKPASWQCAKLCNVF
jgi:NAD(P)H-dependent FMN reductase